MRKNSPRKWLHACLDLLPVILIPVFMIYSHRHTLTERTDVDIQYKYESNEVNSLYDLVEGNIYQYTNDFNIDTNEMTLVGTSFNFSIYKGQVEFETIDTSYFYNEFYEEDLPLHFKVYNEKLFFDWGGDIELSYIFCTDFIISIDDDILTFVNFAINESLEDFSYTDYNVIESVSVNDTNSDIMSVFMDDFNNAIDKYFNMGNVFNLGNIYNWFNTNIFNGNAPVVMFSVWNIVLYEFVMDLMFLLYGLFMWFIDMVQYLMEKPFKSIK